MRYRLLSSLLLGLVVSGQLQATEEALTQSASQAAVCSGCHALPSGAAVPRLQGLSARAIEQQMLALKRSGGQSAMHRLINAYDPAQIRGIANVLAQDEQAP